MLPRRRSCVVPLSRPVLGHGIGEAGLEGRRGAGEASGSPACHAARASYAAFARGAFPPKSSGRDASSSRAPSPPRSPRAALAGRTICLSNNYFILTAYLFKAIFLQRFPMPRGLIAKQRSLQRLCTASTTFHRRSEASSGPSFSSDALTRSAGSLRPDRNCQGLFRGGSANHIRSPAWAVMGRKNRDEGEGWARRGGLLLLAPSPSRAALLAVAVVGWCTHGADAAVAGWPLRRARTFGARC